MGNGLKIFNDSMKEEYINLLFDSYKYLSDIKFQDLLDIIMNHSDINYDVY